jgi:hypothetical protein
MSLRFNIVVFNYELIDLFISNFYKIKHFDPALDIITIVDCSEKYAGEQDRIEVFCKEHGFTPGKTVTVVRRENWGIDQGARLDFFDLVIKKRIPHTDYTWQFQEHYLDTESPHSIHRPGSINVDGRDFSNTVKSDVIPDGFYIDLNICASVFTSDPSVTVEFSCRNNMGLFSLEKDKKWFYTDGGNFCFRTSALQSIMSSQELKKYKRKYDGSYDWALFMEFEYGRLFTSAGCWYDLKNKLKSDIHSFHPGYRFYQENEKEYVSIYRKYSKK